MSQKNTILFAVIILIKSQEYLNPRINLVIE